MSQVDEVRSRADIVKIVGDYVKLRKSGARFVGLCPFHQEKTPSFSLDPNKQLFYCFGCHAGGDVFKFVMQIETLTFPEALGRLAEKAGVTLGERSGDTTFDAGARERTVLYKIHEVAVKFYAAQLGATAEGRTARAYLTDRGLGDETIARFRLGYAPSNGQALARHLAEAGFEAADAEKSGLVLRGAEGERRFDRFRRRVIFPIARDNGKVAAFGARALGEDQPKYLNSPETPIYTKSRTLYNLDGAGAAIRKLDRAVLVEGYMDCIAVASAGIDNVVASCGTSLTESQVRLLGRYSRHVVVNYDPDSAGVAATERSLVVLLEGGFEVRVLALTEGLDPDSFIRQQGAAHYQKLLEAAPAYLDYLTDRATAAHDLRTPEGKIAAANAVMPFLVKVSNSMLRAELANRLAERLRLDDRLLRDELKRAAAQGEREIGPRSALAPVEASAAERELIRAFLESEDLTDEFLAELLDEGYCAGQPAERIFRGLFELRQRGEQIEINRLEASLDPEDRRLVYESVFDSREVVSRDRVADAFEGLKRSKAERERQELARAIQTAEREQNPRRAIELAQAQLLMQQRLAKPKNLP
ncbi:MAG TPA: DNA primase [Terriglobia bacterium]|nr:DNA primase [Terriglobia bacterium]